MSLCTAMSEKFMSPISFLFLDHMLFLHYNTSIYGGIFSTFWALQFMPQILHLADASIPQPSDFET